MLSRRVDAILPIAALEIELKTFNVFKCYAISFYLTQTRLVRMKLKAGTKVFFLVNLQRRISKDSSLFR